MAMDYSSTLPHPSHGGRDGDVGCSTHSPPGPRILRREELHNSPQHDTEDGGQSQSQASAHQHGEDQGGEEAGVDMERGPTVITWRADVTILFIFKPSTQFPRTDASNYTKISFEIVTVRTRKLQTCQLGIPR